MWIIFAGLSALFAGLTAILAKCGIRYTDSDVATAIRTLVVVLFSWIMVGIVGSFSTIAGLSSRTFLFLILSGLATGASWLCYFRALQLGSVNKVVPIDKSSTILTILFAMVILGETRNLPGRLASVFLIAAGTVLMLQRQKTDATIKSRSWFFYALGSAVFAALTGILGKIGITDVESNLGTAIRTVVVVLMAWLMVLIQGKLPLVRQVPRRELKFICLSGCATGASWLCYYKALQIGPVSGVVSIDKLSILVTIGFSTIFLKEKLSFRMAFGLLLITAGTIAIVLL